VKGFEVYLLILCCAVYHQVTMLGCVDYVPWYCIRDTLRSYFTFANNRRAYQALKQTPLYTAVDCGYVEIVDLLVRAGANLEAQDNVSI
jgi:hypothetical protein